MILEVAILNLRAGEEPEFEAAMRVARPLIEASPGLTRFEIRRCVETASRYLLLAEWESVEAHTKGFRQSDRYAQWRQLLHHFYDPFPVVEHYGEALAL